MMKNEKLQTLKLTKFLQSQEIFETANEIEHRKKVFNELEEFYKLWIKEFSLSKDIPASAAGRLGGKIIPYGPYSFNIHYKDFEIDCLCLAPRIIEENEFFEYFLHCLQLQDAVAHCNCVLYESDLIIKLEWKEVRMNLSFLRLSLKEIPADFEIQENPNQDITWHLGSKRSLNCCLTTRYILGLFSDRRIANIDLSTYEMALKTILVWAKRNGLYSSSNGYFDGTTWSILVTRICQLFPSAGAATIVEKFFLIFLLWHWPEPVTIRNDTESTLRFNYIMPVLTPTSPQQNLTLNVSETTKEILLDAFRKAMFLIEDIAIGRASWDYLLATPNFLRRYRQFVVVLVESQTYQGHFGWCNLMDSKLRLLTIILERNRHINIVHAFSNSFQHANQFPIGIYQQPSPAQICEVFQAPFSSLWFIGLDTVDNSENLKRELKESMDCFKELLLMRGRGRLEGGTKLEIYHIRL